MERAVAAQFARSLLAPERRQVLRHEQRPFQILDGVDAGRAVEVGRLPQLVALGVDGVIPVGGVRSLAGAAASAVVV
jgi:hypothetical protein